MPNFGGFSTNRNIASWLDSNAQDFVAMVVSYSALLRSFQSNTVEPIRIAKTQVFPRIGLILAAARDIDNSSLFPDYDSVVDLMTESSSVFSEGITQVAAALTAAILIKQIPLNADIKNIDLGSKIEESAISDLDRIITLYKDSKFTASTSSTEETNKKKATFYFALDVDPTTLPSTYFDVGNVNEVINIKEAYPSSEVKLLKSLNIPSDTIAYGSVEFSSTEYFISSSPSIPITTSNSLEEFFFVENGFTISRIVEEVAETLNNLTLNSFSQSNIIASPNYQPGIITQTVQVKKSRIYPELTGTYIDKFAQVIVTPEYSFIDFEARRLSSVVNRELIILRFYSAKKIDIAKKKANLTITPVYKSTYNTLTTYQKGDVVDSSNGTFVYINDTPIAGSALTSSIYWLSIISTPESLSTVKEYSNNYIAGLLYGQEDSFARMDIKGPKSLILIVENNNIKSATSSSTSSSITNKLAIDTFYFKTEDAGVSSNGVLKLRVASVDLEKFTELDTLVDPDGYLSVNISAGWDSSRVALEVMQSLYKVSQYTDVLGALIHPNAVQIAAFKKTVGEVKEVVDITNAPLGLEIAVGTVLGESTQYKPKQRSLIVEAQAIKDNIATTQTEAITLPNNKDYGVVQVSKHQNSSRIQGVYDRLNLLNKRRL